MVDQNKKIEILLSQFDDKYSVSDDGTIFSLKGKRKELIGKINNCGYREILINHNGTRTYLLVHRLVAQAFLKNPEQKKTINHKDGNKLNNSLYNLEWATFVENLEHARDFGLLNTKITKNIAKQIKNDVGTHRALAKKYGIGKTEIGYIKQNKRWKTI